VHDIKVIMFQLQETTIDNLDYWGLPYLYLVRLNDAKGWVNGQDNGIRMFDPPLEVDWQPRQVAHRIRPAWRSVHTRWFEVHQSIVVQLNFCRLLWPVRHDLLYCNINACEINFGNNGSTLCRNLWQLGSQRQFSWNAFLNVCNVKCKFT